jgi:hypothetical protein
MSKAQQATTKELRAAKAAEKEAARIAAEKEKAKRLAARPQRKRGKALVLPSYSLKTVKPGDSLMVRVDSLIESKPDVEQSTGEQKKDKKGKPAFIHLVNVTDLDTGVVGQMVLPFIIHQAFEKLGDDLKDKEFELVKGREETNKATMWEIYSLE